MGGGGGFRSGSRRSYAVNRERERERGRHWQGFSTAMGCLLDGWSGRYADTSNRRLTTSWGLIGSSTWCNAARALFPHFSLRCGYMQWYTLMTLAKIDCEMNINLVIL